MTETPETPAVSQFVSRGSVAQFIEALGAEERPRDWRRDQAAEAAGPLLLGFDALTRREFVDTETHHWLRGRLAELALDPQTAVVHYLHVIGQRGRFGASAGAKLVALCRQWGDIRGRWPAEYGPTGRFGQLDVFLARAAALSPALREDAQLLAARAWALRHIRGLRAALSLLGEDGGARSEPAAVELVCEFSELLLQQDPRVSSLDAAFAFRGLDAWAPASRDRLRIQRAAGAFHLRWNLSHGFLPGEDGDAASLEPMLEAAARDLQTIAQDLPPGAAATDPEAFAELFLGLASAKTLWRSPAPEVEAWRRRLLEAAVQAAPRLQSGDRHNRFASNLLQLGAQSVGFWSDIGFRHGLIAAVEAASRRVPLVQRAVIQGFLRFLEADTTGAATSFAEAAARDPNGSGFPSYIDPESLPVADRSASPEIGQDGAGQPASLASPAVQRGAAIVAVSSDINYGRRYLPKYAASLASLRPGTTLLWHAMCSPDEAAEVIAATQAVARGAPPVLRLDAEFVNRAYFFATKRFVVASELLNEHDAPLIVTDIDQRWDERSVRLLDELGFPGDVGIRLFDAVRYYRMSRTGEGILRFPRLRPWETISASCIVFQPTPAARRFAALLRETARQALQAAEQRPAAKHWWIDQNILASAYLRARQQGMARFFNLETLEGQFAPFCRPPDGYRAPLHTHWVGEPAPGP